MRPVQALNTNVIDHPFEIEVQIAKPVIKEAAVTTPADPEMAGVGRGIGALVGGGFALANSMYLASLFISDLVHEYSTMLLFALVVYSLTFLGGWAGAKAVAWVENYEKNN